MNQYTVVVVDYWQDSRHYWTGSAESVEEAERLGICDAVRHGVGARCLVEVHAGRQRCCWPQTRLSQYDGVLRYDSKRA